MARIANNPSGKYVQMDDAQVARAQAAHERAVARQGEEDARRAAASRTVAVRWSGLDWLVVNGNGVVLGRYLGEERANRAAASIREQLAK